jgi:hypothetical protein
VGEAAWRAFAEEEETTDKAKAAVQHALVDACRRRQLRHLSMRKEKEETGRKEEKERVSMKQRRRRGMRRRRSE